jgi:hypothetical protein
MDVLLEVRNGDSAGHATVAGEVSKLAFGDAGADIEWQTELDDEAAVGAIFGSYGAAVQADGAVGDGKAEAGTTRGAVAGITDAIEGQEDITE